MGKLLMKAVVKTEKPRVTQVTQEYERDLNRVKRVREYQVHYQAIMDSISREEGR